MSIHVRIEHMTSYRYDRPVALSPQLIRLRPAPHTRTPIHEYSLEILPAEHRLDWQEDPFGNQIGRALFSGPVRELRLTVHLVAEMTVLNPFDFFVESYAEQYPFRYDALFEDELEPYFELGESGELLRAWLDGVDRRPRHIVDFLVALNQRLRRDVDYAVRLDPGVQSCEQTLGSAIGSCRDTAWLLVQILRHLGLAARFVSGYLIQLTADEKSLDGPSGPEEDFTDLHAWAEVYIPGAGWIGLDPTSGLLAGEGHIPLACTPDPVSAAPLTGSSEDCRVEFRYHNVVRRIREPPRVTKPYSEEDWRAIRELGKKIDVDLVEGDVRLTMGGEPTFVSIDDMDGEEWNTAALGLDKRNRAGILVRRLKEAFAPGGVLHFGQGKWYPGEPLPRWALGCVWRVDGQPLWSDAALLADEGRSYGHGIAEAAAFGRELALRCGARPEHLFAGFEDWLHYLWREAKQPVDRDAIAIPWAPQCRDDLSLALARGLDTPTGYALPLTWSTEVSAWSSHHWNLPGGTMFLLPGGSPMGFRLALDRLDPDVAPSALCIEPRHGRLYVFLPPTEDFEAYLSLLAAIEQSAARLALPVVLEGYKAPRSPLLRSLEVTPDPGVIEVNIHPASTWEALEHNVTTLYEHARQTRLGTEKFMVDGRHSGTGGGNHLTLGGPTAADSPFLRRPDLLRSLITFWQHHPSLSYLFAGQFIGPTSQAPRIDEHGCAWLGEIERSFAEIEREPEPWLVDRALRSFLADVTGNTHRAEFCIDKLYSADGPAGRQGLVELRAFEMPPHARMSLVQMLLVRALVARFWQQPYHHPLVSWGTALYDRFLLPHFVWLDFQSVIDELGEAGYPVRVEWFAPFYEFRFPLCGRCEYAGVEIELRTALEPWLVVGDDVTAQQQARAVDSSLERLQVTCRGFDPERYDLTCNGRQVPLRRTGPEGDCVAGIRFKAWPCDYGLHPTIPVHAPLTFDLVDRALGRSVGGCVYHVSHPGGRAFDSFPVNAYEAEGRRIARFWAWGHTAERDVAAPAAAPQADSFANRARREPANPDYPHTLDLRREAAR
jgi:uncharacterized protein (DUF2126 family)/transglutaminase-like putative cysteine protease